MPKQERKYYFKEKKTFFFFDKSSGFFSALNTLNRQCWECINFLEKKLFYLKKINKNAFFLVNNLLTVQLWKLKTNK
jgi:hypothetical protein